MTNIFGQIFTPAAQVSSFWDNTEPDVADDSAKKESPTLEYDFDPLAFTIAALRQGETFHLTDIHGYLMYDSDILNESLKNVKIDDSALEYSEQIRRYYKNRLLIRRLKGLYVTDFMTAMEQVLESNNSIKQDHIKILLKLPDFYRENIETDALYKNCESIKVEHSTFQEFDDVFTFVSTIKRNAKKDNALRYYFKNSKNNFLMYNVKSSDKCGPLLDYIIHQDRPIRINGYSTIKPQPGYEDFNIYQEGNFKFLNV